MENTPTPDQQTPAPAEQTSSGLQPNIAAALCYALGFITGLIFIITEKENKFVRFHAMQSIVTFGTLFVVSMGLGAILFISPTILVPLMYGLDIIAFILWVILIIKAYNGEKFKLPVVGDIAEKNA